MGFLSVARHFFYRFTRYTHTRTHSNIEASQCQCARDNDDDDGCNDDKRALSIFMKNV